MTLLRLEGEADGGPVLFARVKRRQVFVTYFVKDDSKASWDLAAAEAPLGEGLRHHVALTDTGNELTFYVDGVPYGCRWHAGALPRFARVQTGADGGRRVLRGEMSEPVFFGRCLEPAEVARQYAAAVPEAGRQAAEALRQKAAGQARKGTGYRALRVADGALHPLIDQLAPSATAVAWHDGQGRDLLADGVGFGSRLVLYRFAGIEGGLPVYGHGEPVGGLPRGRYQAVRNGRGTSDLFSVGAGRFISEGHLAQYVSTGAPGEPAFAPRRALFDGQPMLLALKGGVAAWAVADIDGDGVEDFLYARTLSLGGDTRFPFEGNPWTGKEQRYAGPGKGYDIRGVWLGNDVIGEFYWAPGRRGKDGALDFGAPRQVMTRVEGYPLLWKTIGSTRALTVLDIGGRRYLLLAGSIDELLAVEVTCRDGEVVACGEARAVLRGGYELPHTFLVTRISSVDLDGDGAPELLLDGNPGVAAVLKGRRVGEFEAVGVAQTRGGRLAAETLASPCRFDWDGDGVADVLTGDASGRLWLWPGTADAWTYRPPMAMTAGGVAVKPVAGMSGSIQGSNEKRWGYLKVVAGMWGGAKAVITDDITGTLTLYRAAAGGAERLTRGEPFTLRGEAFRVAWRSRPDIVAGATGFAGVPHDALLVQDWDGDLAVAVPEAEGGTDLREVVKLRYADGGAIRLCGPAGLWGRGAVALADWDGDGRLDLLFGTNRSCQRFFSEEAASKGAVPFLLRNEGSDGKPLFARPKPFRLASGAPLDFGVHNATPWVTDLDGDGKPDLLVGAEDGKVYGFLHGELVVD